MEGGTWGSKWAVEVMGLRAGRLQGPAGRRSDSEQLLKGGPAGIATGVSGSRSDTRSCPDLGVACTPEEDRVQKSELGKETTSSASCVSL